MRWKAICITTVLLASSAFVAAGPSHEDLSPVTELLSTLSGYRVVTLDSDAIREQADRGEQVTLDLGTIVVRAMLAYNPMRAPDYVAGFYDANGTFNRIYEPRAMTYRGDVYDKEGVLDVDGTEVRLTLDPGAAAGYVRIGDETYNIEPVSKKGLAGPAPHIVYRNTDLLPFLPTTGIHDDSNHNYPTPEELKQAAEAALGAQSHATYNVRVVLAGDPRYVSDQGGMSNAFASMEADLNQYEGIFSARESYHLLIAAKLAVTEADIGGCWSADSMTNTINPALNAKYRAGNIPDFHMAHLWTGRDLRHTCEAGGSLYGYGSGDLGTARMTSIIQMVAEEAYFPNQNAAHRRWVGAHEMGHIHGGRHCLADFYFTGGPFTAEFRKSTLAPWASMSDAERASSPDCNDVPGDGWIYFHNYNDRFSDGTIDASNNNHDAMRLLGDAHVPAPAQPNTPGGPLTGTTHTPLTYTFNMPAALCNGYYEVDWGDGTTTGRPQEWDRRCGAFTLSKTYTEAASYSVRLRVQRDYHSTWSPWSNARTTAVSCLRDDPGPGCDASNTFAGASLVSSSPLQGWILTNDPTDFYRISVPSGASISASVTPPSCSDYDLYLWNPSGTLVAGSGVGGCATESVSTSNALAGDWRLEVRAWNGANNLDPYSLSWSIVSPNQPPTVSISSPASGATVSGTITISGTAADSDGSVQLVEIRIDSGPWQTATGTTSWSRSWDTTTVSNGGHTISARSWDGQAYSTIATRSVTVSNGGGGGGEIARYDGWIQSDGEWGQSGTFITFNSVSSGSPISVTYKYCYLGNSNGRTGHIRTVFDGTTVDNFGFTTPYTGGGTCTSGNVATYATRTFSVSSGVSSSIRFDYTNGDWKLSIADIVVTGPSGSGPVFSDNFESGTNGWTSTGLWRMDTRKSSSPTTAWWYGQGAIGSENYNTGATNSGRLWSPWITIPTSGTPQLKFQSWYLTEDTGTSWDTKKVYVSTDGSTIPSSHLLQVSGTNQQWVLQTASLSSYLGQTIKLVFVFETVDATYNDHYGWVIDDVQVTRN